MKPGTSGGAVWERPWLQDDSGSARGKQPGLRVATDKGGGALCACTADGGASQSWAAGAQRVRVTPEGLRRVRGESSPATGCRQEGCGETAAGQMRCARLLLVEAGREARCGRIPGPTVLGLQSLRRSSHQIQVAPPSLFWVGERSWEVSWARARYSAWFGCEAALIRNHSLKQRKDSKGSKGSWLRN